jgi:hypothetical protein
MVQKAFSSSVDGENPEDLIVERQKYRFPQGGDEKSRFDPFGEKIINVRSGLVG